MATTGRDILETDDFVEEVIPLIEETATVSKREIVTGRVRIRIGVETEERLLQEELSEERVEVERVPIDRVVDAVPLVRSEGDVTIIPVVEERLVVTKELVLVEEVRVRRVRSTETVEVPVTLRSERASVERLEAEPVSIPPPPNLGR